MRYSLYALLIAVALVSLTGCGQMGPLYLPTGETVPEQPVAPADDPQSATEES